MRKEIATNILKWLILYPELFQKSQSDLESRQKGVVDKSGAKHEIKRVKSTKVKIPSD